MAGDWDVVAGPGTAPSGYMSEAEFRQSMDRVFGRGKWQETGGWRSQAREDQLRAQGANTVPPGHTSPHSLGTEDAPGAHDVVVSGMSPQQAAARMRAEGLPVANAYPEGASGSQGAHLHVALSEGQEDPWTPVAGPGVDPWQPVAGPGSEQHHGFFDEASRLGRSLVGGIASGAGKVVKGMGELGDIVAQSQLGQGAETGFITDPATGIPMRVPEAARPSFAAAARQPVVSPVTDKAAKGLSDWDVMVSPPDRNLGEGIVHGAGEIGLPAGAAMVNPLLGGATFAAQGLSETRDEAKAAGASDETATAAGLESGAIQGVIGMTPVGEVAAPIVRGIKGAIPHFLADLGVRSAADAGLGAGMQVGENVVAEQNYDPDRPWYANVPQSAAAMGLGGAGLHIAHAGAGAAFGAARSILRPGESPVDTGAPDAEPAPQPADDLAAAMPEAVAAHAYATNTAHIKGAVTPDEVPVQPVEPPASYEEARVAEGAPIEEMAPAIADVAEVRGAAPKGYSLFQAIRDMGGVRTRTPDGEPISDVQQVLDGVRRPGLINNKTGLDPDTLREALQERGWFGVQDGEGAKRGDTLNDLYGLMDQEARGTKVYHPEDTAPQAILRRAEMERDLTLAGVGPQDPSTVAAAKLAAYRANLAKESGVGMTLLRERAKALGVEHTPDMAYDDLLGDVVEREAIQGEYDGAQADQHERIIDEQLTPEEHEWLAAAGAGGEGERGPAQPSEETGWEPAFEPGEAERYQEPGPGAGGGAEGPQGLPEPHQLGPSEPQTLGGEAVEQNLIPGTEASARQAAAAREGALRPQTPQEAPGGLFEERGPDQPGMFEQPPSDKPEGRAAYGEANRFISREQYEQAKARMRARMRDQLNAGLDPEALHDGFLMTAFHIEAGARRFGEYARAMLEDLGEGARPYLKSWYEAARHAPGFDTHGMTPEPEVTPEVVARAGADPAHADLPPAERIQAQASDQVEAARKSGEIFQPAALPVTTASPPEPAPHDLFSVGDAVRPAPADAWRSPVSPKTPRRVVNVAGSGHQLTLDGGAQFAPDELRLDAREPNSTGKEPTDGLQGSVPPGAAGARSGAVHEPAPKRPAGRLPAGKEPGGAPLSGRDAGAGADRAERPAIGPAGVPAGGGAGHGPDAGLPAAAERADAGAAGRSADAAVSGENYRIEPGGVAEERSPKTKARDNLDAIRLAKQLIADSRAATREEQAILAKYAGWGGLSGAFEDSAGKMGKGLEEVGAELKTLLTPEEYRTASRSTQYAHYTAEHVIRAMWKAVEDMGFAGGTVIEPGMGVGHFLGMAPPDLAEKIHYQGIEMDGLTADIARLLYPRAGVRHADFTRSPIPENTFDLAIGNPPFSDTVIKADPKYAARGFLLHDYFFAKSLDSVRPGGLLAFVTSAGTMNKMDVAARKYLAQRAEFLGGARLPSNTFRRNAGTDVTADVLFFQKRATPLSGEVDEPWTQTVIRDLPDANGQVIQGRVNRYFSEHPEQVLGDEGFFDKLYQGRYAVHAREGVDPHAELRGALARLPKDVLQPEATPHEKAEVDFSAPEHKDGSFYLQDGRLMQYADGAGRPVAGRGKGVEGGISAADQQRITHLIPIRDALREVFHHDLAENERSAAVARAQLNAAYDRFVAKYGPINKAEFQFRRPTVVQQEAARAEARELARDRGAPWNEGSFDPESLGPKATLAAIAEARRAARERLGPAFDEGDFNPEDMPDTIIEKRPNIAAFMDDPESYRLRAIEHYNDATGEATKKDVFHRSVITREVEPQLNSANDGVLWSLNHLGRFDVDAIAEKMGRTPDDILTELGDRVFRLPGTERTYQTSDEYLSGDVFDKLAEASSAAGADPDMRRNVAALKAALPAPLAPSEISMNLGMPWIPKEEVEAFAREHLRIGDVSARHSGALGGWVVGSPHARGPGDAEWSTSDMDAEHILTAALNRHPVRIYKSVYVDGRKTSEFDPVATQGVVDKIDAMKAAFQEFVQGDAGREARLADIYNDAMNRTVLRKYDGSYLTTPGVASDWSWRPHQQRVVARIVQSGNTYMAHAVGAGKTSAMIGAGMEMRRLGLVKKPMYVVPNHMLGQFTKEFYEQYPTARIAVADDRRFHTSRRKQFVANVAQDDLDAVIITHSAFGKIPISADFQKQIIADEVDRVALAMEGLDKQTDRITIKKLENLKEKLEQRLAGAMGSRKDATNTFEELGVDNLFVDEAHMFRKLSFATRQSMKGIDPNGSEMAWDLYSKIKYLETRNPGRSATLASGTPVTNTMGELYTLSRYMQPRELQRLGLDHFDSWSANFGDTKTSLEQTPDGSYAPVTRFSKFVNMPELYKMVGQVMDIVTPAQLEQYVVRPKLEGGARMFHLAPNTDFMKSVQAGLAARMAAIKQRRGPPKPGDDILLSVINDGRHSAIDPRFVDPSADPRSPSKLNEMIDNVHRIWEQTRDQQFYDPRDGYKSPTFKGPATQMIFANLGINASEARPFSGYGWIRSELQRRGVPPSEIAFIGDYKSHLARQKLFNDMNEGKVRILVGSTQKMGTGVNAQRRLYALHNQDPLWYPADDEQRVGRALRQGNLNPTIQIHDYSTKGTYDATMWQMMGNKARFIEQFFRGDPELREMEDLGEASHFEQAAAMATTDERLIALTDLRQQLQRAERRKQTHEREQYSMGQRRRLEAQTIDDEAAAAASVQRDIARRTDTRGDAFRATVAGKVHADRAKAAEAMEKEYKQAFPGIEFAETHKLGEVGGFALSVRKGISDEPTFHLEREGGSQKIGDASMSMKGMIASIEKRLPNFESEIAYHQERQDTARRAIESLDSQIGKPFTGGDEITGLRTKIKGLEAEIEASNAGAKTVGAPDLAKDTEEPPGAAPSDGEAPTLRRGAGFSDGVSGPGVTPLARGLEGVEPDAISQQAHADLIDQVGKIIAKIAPTAVSRPMRAMREPGSGSRVEAAAWRQGARHVVAWSLDTPDAVGAARHEAVHVLRGQGLFKPQEWNALAAEAMDGGWMGRYHIAERYPDLTHEGQVEEAVAERFADWRRDRQMPLPPFVRELFNRIAAVLQQVAAAARKVFGKDATAADVFAAMERGEVGRRGAQPEGRGAAAGELAPAFQRPRPEEPEEPEAAKARGAINRMLGEGVDSLGARVASAANRVLPDPVHDLMDSFRMGVSPMSVGSERAKATAKDFANTLRETAWEWNRIDGWLEKNFTPEQRRQMWEAADEESVIRQKGAEPGPSEGLNRLRGGERAIVEELQKRADQAFARAKALGMTKADPLPSYVPRMVVEMTGEGARRVRGSGATSAATGRNLSTTTGQLRHREHLTAEETEAAAKAAFGEGASVVRDIRTLGLATGKLEQAIAGRTLIDKIREIGKSVGENTVAEGANPEPGAYFTIDHPAMKVWGPKFVIDHETGKMTTIDGPDGKPVMEAKPLYIAKEFEGPLKSVLTTPTGPIYNAFVGLKAKAMSLIMYSPVMHNAVIWGKAIPAAPRQVLTFEIYRRGNAAKNDTATMREAIQAGLDPIGRRYFNQDVTAIAEGPQIAPGRSWTARLIGSVPGLFDRGAGESTMRAIDRAGDVWHNTFLWDRVADLQMGLYKTIRDSEIKKGLDPQSAQRLAAHFANRYAGALPIEGMSKLARQTANVMLFSRSFTLGNLGAYKDIVRGLPGEVQAQILRDSGAESLNHVQGEARRKAIGMLALDVALSYAGLWLGAAATAWIGHHAFQSPDQNEPGKEKRFLIRTQPDGTAIYGRLPTGKVGEEMTDWWTEPMETLKRKLSPAARLMYEVAANDKGFGRKLYDPYDKTPMGLAKNIGRVVWAVLSSLAPLGQIEGMKGLASGQGDKTSAALQAFLPLAGVTVSKGAPGGPPMADVYAAKDQHEFAVQEALPGIMQQVRAGDLVGARKAMNALGIPSGLANYYIRVARNPQSRLTSRSLRDFRTMATPEERGRFVRDRAAAAQEREGQ